MTSKDNPFDRMFEEMIERMNEMMEEMSEADDVDAHAFGFTNLDDEAGAGPGGFRGFGDFGDFGGEGFGAGGAGPAPGAHPGEPGTHVDVLEEEEVVRVVADMPGVEKDEITVSVSGDKLRIEASNDEREYDERVTLPSRVDEASGEASYNNGVLEISFEKTDGEDETEIDIE